MLFTKILVFLQPALYCNSLHFCTSFIFEDRRLLLGPDHHFGNHCIRKCKKRLLYSIILFENNPAGGILGMKNVFIF